MRKGSTKDSKFVNRSAEVDSSWIGAHSDNVTAAVTVQVQSASPAGIAVNVKPDCIRAIGKRHRHIVPQTVVGDCAGGVDLASPEATKGQGIIATIDEELLAPVSPRTIRSLGENVVFDPGYLSLDPGNY